MALSSFFRRPAWPLTLGLALGCASGQPEPQTPTQAPPAEQQSPAGQQPFQPAVPVQPGPQQPGAQRQEPLQTPAAPGSALAPAAAPTPAPAPGAALPSSETPVSLATPIDASAAAPVQPVLSQLAASSAPPGAKPIGAVMAANFQQGQQLEAQVQMEPGRCYTLVGAGLPPTVTEVDLKLVAITPMAGMPPILAADNTSGVQAVLGERPNCFKWDWPIPAPVKVVISVTGGSGLAAAQLFAK